MYGWIFSHLPGPLWVRIFLSLALIAAVLVVLVQFVFPWVEQHVPLFNQSTVGALLSQTISLSGGR